MGEAALATSVDAAGLAQQNKALKAWREGIDKDPVAFTDRYSTVPASVPVLLVHGSGDQVNGFYHSQHLHSLLPHAQLLDLGPMGHNFWHMDGGAGAQQIFE